MYVYNLIYEKQNKGIESMNIGYYSSYKKARKVKKKYQAIVPGFKDHSHGFKIKKQKQAILFSQKDKEIIREISQCNNSYYKTKVLDVLQCELSDWSYDISKYMIKDKNRLIAEKSISVIQEFKRLEDFLNLFEQYQKDEFINYELIEAIGYIGIMRQLDDDIIEKRMKEILQNLEKKGYAKYRIYDYLFYITKNEKYLDAILNGLQSWDDDIRYQALYTVEDVIINEDDNKWLKKINKKLIDNIEKDKRYNRIYRERLINRIRERMGKKKTIICQKEKKLYQRLLLGGKFILQRCVFELYYPVNNDRYEMILELLEKNRTNMMEEQFFIFGSYVESIYGNSEINRYQQWLENNGSEENKALILYLRAVWEVAKDEYDLFNETALKYARESLECDKDIPAVYHIIGRLTSPDTSEYEKIKKDLKKHVVYISLQEIEEMSLNKLYSYDTFLKMDILKKIIKPKNFSLILLEEVSDNFWNWEL